MTGPPLFALGDDIDWPVVGLVAGAFVVWPALYLVLVWRNHKEEREPEFEDYADPEPGGQRSESDV